jgi:transcriptional regulator GlxA family with amidase domain
VTAGIDLSLALVEQDLRRSVALAVARYLLVFLKRPGGQAQFGAALTLQAAEDRFGALHDWIHAHLADDLSLPILADRAGMSEGSFSRHYVEANRMTPVRAVERLRVEAARRLLSESRSPVKRIARRWPRSRPQINRLNQHFRKTNSKRAKVRASANCSRAR